MIYDLYIYVIILSQKATIRHTDVTFGRFATSVIFCSHTSVRSVKHSAEPTMLLSDDAATLECKYAAQQWLQSEDPLIRDFGARLQSILAFQQNTQKKHINHGSL